MKINGITFDPTKVTEILNTSDEAVTVIINDNNFITFGFETSDQADAVVAQIKAARNEIELADGVTFDKVEKRFSTKHLTIEVAKIDALYEQYSRIYVISGNNEFLLTSEAQIAIDKVVAYCPQLTKIEDYYINKEKSKGFFVEQRGLDSWCEIYLSVNNLLLYIEQFRDIIPAVNRCEELNAEYKF